MSRRPRPHPPTGFTIVEVIVVIIAFLLLVGLLFFVTGTGSRRSGIGMRQNSAQLRGIHQTMVIYSQSNNTYLPGLDSNGALLADGSMTGQSGGGGTPSARLWILLNGQFIPPEYLLHPSEPRRKFDKWFYGPVTKKNFSYAVLQIEDPQRDAGRLIEWRDNANSQAAFLCDRNAGAGVPDNQVRALWATNPGDWRGSLVWGDNSAEFVQSDRGLQTRYNKITGSNDNLFIDGPTPEGNPATERGTKPGSNAMMVWY